MSNPTVSVTETPAVIEETPIGPATITVGDPALIIEVPTAPAVALTAEPTVSTVEVGIAGPQGPAGPSAAASSSYRHVQAVPAAVWTVVHGLGAFLNVTAVDSTGREIEGDVVYVDGNTLTITFSGAVGGEAYVS